MRFHMPNKRVEHAHGVRSTRKGDALLLAAHAGRSAAERGRGTFRRSL